MRRREGEGKGEEGELLDQYVNQNANTAGQDSTVGKSRATFLFLVPM